jgi:hypothetical protein
VAAAPPGLAGVFTGRAYTDAGTPGVIAAFSGPPSSVTGTFDVDAGAVLRDCYGSGDRTFGGARFSLSGFKLGPSPAGGDRYLFSGQFQMPVPGAGITAAISVTAPAADLSPDGRTFAGSLSVSISPPWPLSACNRVWWFSLTTTALAPPAPPPTPYGWTDEVVGLADGTISVKGWSIDPDHASGPTDVHVYTDGPWNAATNGVATTAGIARSDVAYPDGGSPHGFATTIGAAPGNHTVYVYAINTPGTPGANVLLGTYAVTVPPPVPVRIIRPLDPAGPFPARP